MLDTIIIGAGPAGITAAIYASRAALNFVLIEKVGYAGGQIVTTNDLDNYPGMPNIDGASFAMALQSHAEKFGTNIVMENVVKIEKKEDNTFEVSLENGEVLKSRTVIYGTGANPRHLNIPGEDKYLSKGVYYCATCDGAFFKNKVTAVIGGGNTALEDALFLSKICEKVYLVHRRDELRGDKHSQEKIFATKNIEFVKSALPEEILGDKTPHTLRVFMKNEDAHKNIKIDGIFVAVGMIPNNSLVPEGVDLDDTGYIVAGEDCKTSMKGFFAIGDVRTKEVRQVITACADGASVIKSISDFLNEN